MSSVLFDTHALSNGQQILEITLNAERSLNALSLEMVDLILPQLEMAARDDNIVAVILDSVGEKAFCAGGDVVNLYKSMVGEISKTYGEEYFQKEYHLDYMMHTFPKPMICWGNGIVMGGGIGMLSGCSHRVVTEASMLAMPEVTIGLYPDVGASWFLNRAPGRTGLFLGLSGARCNAKDAQFIGLADRLISGDKREHLVPALLAADWSLDAHHAVSNVLRELEQESEAAMQTMPSPVREHYDLIQQITDAEDIQTIVAQWQAVELEDKWFNKTQQLIRGGSPLSLHLIYQQLRRTKHLSLREVFLAECALSTQCMRDGDLAEGIRALLIDKDGQPKWKYGSLEAVTPEVLEVYFEQPWAKNPLDALI